METLSGLNVAVTGAAAGIGRAIAAQFAVAGAHVTVGDIDADAVRAAGGVQLDVADRESFAAFLDAAEQAHGPLAVMVNNAGIDWIGAFHEEPDAVTRREIEVNLYGAIVGSKLALERMLPRGGGYLVNVASGVGRVPLPGSATYSATKHGVVGLTESLRLEYRGRGVHFTLVQPAQVETAMLDGQARPRALPQVSPDDVAAAVLDAIARHRFEVWVPASQAITAKLAAVMPRRAREAVMRALGVTKIAGDTDLAARRAYHEKMFPRD